MPSVVLGFRVPPPLVFADGSGIEAKRDQLTYGCCALRVVCFSPLVDSFDHVGLEPSGHRSRWLNADEGTAYFGGG